jgi:hypothetical protein
MWRVASGEDWPQFYGRRGALGERRSEVGRSFVIVWQLAT